MSSPDGIVPVLGVRPGEEGRGNSPQADASKRQIFLLAAILILLCCAAAFGGSSYLSAPGWPVLFIVGSLGTALGLITLSAHDVRRYPGVLLIGAAACLLPALQLIPLPPDVWQSLPGRDLVKAVDTAAGLGAPWRPLSLVPVMTEHALMSLLVPVSLVLLAVQLDDHHQERLLWIVLLLILGSALLAVAQNQLPMLQGLLGYRRLDAFIATGLFSNRNHQALLMACGLPLLLAAVRQRSAWLRQFGPVAVPTIVLGGALILLAMILVTGSRAGVLLYSVALAGLPLMWPQDDSANARGESRPPMRLGLSIGSGVLMLALITVIAADNWTALAVIRLLDNDPVGDLRPVIFKQTAGFLGTYWPAGTGIGTFIPIYALEEPVSLMQTAYINQAHNDWLDIALTGGAPGVAILLCTSLYLLWLAARHFFGTGGHARGQIFGRCAFFVVLLCGLASIVDFPLRTPLMMSILALALVWTARPLTPPARTHGRSHRKHRA